MSFTLLKDNTVTAVIEHRCIWCGETISKGERYRYQTGILDREFQSNHWHHECFEAAMDCLVAHDDGFTPYEHERGGCEE